jgi:hypothetical protein
MLRHIINNLNYWVVVIASIILLSGLLIASLSSCFLYNKIVPYKTFSSTNRYLDFTFEYPAEFNEKMNEYKDWPDSPNGAIEITLESSTATIYVDTLDVTDNNTSLSFQQSAYYSLKSQEEIFNQIKNLEILKRDTITIDGVAGYELEMKYDDLKKSTLIGSDFQAYERNISLQHENRLYALGFFVKASQTGTIEGFQDLLDTWKWK